MPKIAEFYAELGLKKDKFDKGIDQTVQKTSALNSKMSQLAVGIAAAFSARAVLNFASQSVKAYNQQAQAEQGLLVALKGRRDVQQALIEQASELQGKTLFGDEVTLEAQKQLAVFGLTKRQILELIPLIQDFATSQKMDLAQAANLVGKAIGSGTNALSRYGIELDTSASKTDKVAQLVEGLTTKFKGQAEAMAAVGSGPMQQASNAAGDLAEQFGKLISVNTAGFFKSLTNDLLSMNNVISNESVPTLQKYISLFSPAARYENELRIAAYKRVNAGKDAAKEALQEAKDKVTALRAELAAILANNAAKADARAAAAAEAQKEAAIKAAEERKKAIEEEIKLLDDLRKAAEETALSQAKLGAQFTSWSTDSGAMSDAAGKALSASSMFGISPDEEESEEDPAWLTKLGEDLQRGIELTQNFKDNAKDMLEAFSSDVIGEFFQNIGAALVDGGLDTSFNAVIGQFGDFLAQMGKMMIAYGVAQLALFESFFEGPVGAIKLIAAGAALTVIGGAISALAAKGPAGGASTTGMSGYGGSSQFSNTPGISGQQMLYTEISGDNLRIILDRSNRTTTRRY